jgi:hypothetical protein
MDQLTFTVTNDDGSEAQFQLPAMFEVCPNCEGHGTHLREGIRDHAYTAEEFEEAFDDEERSEYFRHGGRYDVTCEECEGKRVVLVVNRDACVSQAQKDALRRYDAEQEDDAAFRREIEAERRMGC